jgi:Rod binding domain-containing protein
MDSGLVSLAGTPSSPAGRNDPQRTQAAAGEFEALLIGSLLKSMREAGSSGWLGTGEDQASESLMEIAEQQLARVMAAQGGLGLARLVVRGLAPPPVNATEQKAPAGR